MSEISKGVIVEILPTAIWIESDIFGSRHVVLQHQGCDPFTYASFQYDYRYTSNAGTWEAARNLALALGATEPIEQKHRNLSFEPAREWEGLTDEEMANTIGFREHLTESTRVTLTTLGRRIEAKLREKNA